MHTPGSALKALCNFCVALKTNDFLRNDVRCAQKRSGCVKLNIYLLNDTPPSWLQLMIQKMWVVVTHSTCRQVRHWLVCNGCHRQKNHNSIQKTVQNHVIAFASKNVYSENKTRYILSYLICLTCL